MKDPKFNAENRCCSKLYQIVMVVRSFYNKNFPIDNKTYSLRVALIGLILSTFSVHLVSTKFVSPAYFNYDSRNYGVLFCYLFLATVLSYELFYGLKIGDRKHYSPWILFKLVEVGFVVMTIIRIFEDNRWRLYRLDRYIGDIIYGFMILGLNSASTLYVISVSWKQLRESPPNTEVKDDNSDTSALV